MTLAFFPYCALPTHCFHRVAPQMSKKNAAISEMNIVVQVYLNAQQIYDFDERCLNTKLKLS